MEMLDIQDILGRVVYDCRDGLYALPTNGGNICYGCGLTCLVGALPTMYSLHGHFSARRPKLLTAREMYCLRLGQYMHLGGGELPGAKPIIVGPGEYGLTILDGRYRACVAAHLLHNGISVHWPVRVLGAELASQRG